MKDLAGKTAFITGGASGIGLAMARAFGKAGMNVMLADINEDDLAVAVTELKERQIKAAGVRCDVTERKSVERAAQETVDAFGKVHLVCNNAGVGAGGAIGTVKPGDWDWTIAVNLMGVVYGMEAFLPHIRAHGEGGHYVNTASMAGMISVPGMEPYTASKYAVVGMSEGWAGQLAPENIGVSVLCPGFVKTRIFESGRARQDKYGPASDERDPDRADAAKQLVLGGIDPDRVGERVLEAVEAGELYIFTHPDMAPLFADRARRIEEAFARAAESRALQGLDYRTPGKINVLD
ncbi:SDR family NAD(P)-dependent oxidoreductase [Parvibaculum sp.]|mgnify:CR=1 FL=1|jgi:NAD(P)-dependent dehydrogenase (short-subunit alcohol dehydrogenase family)|uniref:SDR family NAD(P)-dependent oxidoreductase n=1 Tax=Parvibaculum sp. TaxID=2024848 RepID=UPI001B255623|nr:SDR family NAD(P)-dependent oxidoreductase [Parvibaculum sp.]MBO6669598.1 SDR family NAD(P)-dependent oxidoreductase [Parvibaculum sp.]MBO6691947.1 SDR family NAD(P)-dependent oxidoreductase [Parvibaculum sp.]MBO6715984.1 SDR family NAD(P)-dependent oxidoreductase [Parvibaculum sp.]|tara:strand:- start:4269 stop:5147 length:879 start_codon:yes stop_codon:yes gene_type:complete